MIRVLPVRGVLVGTAGRVAFSVFPWWGLRVSSSEGFPQLVERARDVRHTIDEPFEEVPDPLDHSKRLTRETNMCRLEVTGPVLTVIRESQARQPAPW